MGDWVLIFFYREEEGKKDLDLSKPVIWRVINTEKKSKQGNNAVSYALFPAYVSSFSFSHIPFSVSSVSHISLPFSLQYQHIHSPLL